MILIFENLKTDGIYDNNDSEYKNKSVGTSAALKTTYKLGVILQITKQ